MAPGRLACDTVIVTGTEADSSAGSEGPQFGGERSPGKTRWRLNEGRGAVVNGLITAVALIVAALITVYATSHSAGSESPTAAVSRSYPSPLSVVEAYLAAINSRNWSKAWHIGGDHLNNSYSSMVAGFRTTRRDVLQTFKRDGDRVTADIAAYGTNGTVQYFALHFIVQRGVITGGYGSKR